MCCGNRRFVKYLLNSNKQRYEVSYFPTENQGESEAMLPRLDKKKPSTPFSLRNRQKGGTFPSFNDGRGTRMVS